MRLNHKIIYTMLATSALAFGTLAQAEPATHCDMGPGMMHDHMKDGGDPAARVEQHLAHFKAELKLTPAQEPAWKTFADQVKAGAGQGMKAMREQAKEAMPAPERMTQRMAMMKERLAAMEAHVAAFKTFYDTLTPEQKAIADKHAMFGEGMRGKGKQGKGKPGKDEAADHKH